MLTFNFLSPLKRACSSISMIVLLSCISCYQSTAQSKEERPSFTIEKKVDATPVKTQGNTGTCWSFATSSFIESEAIRQGKGNHDISEMFFVRQNYPKKAMNYVRYHGKSNFGEGSLSHDVIYAAKEFGILPEEIYNGKHYGKDEHDHAEMFNLLEGMVKAVVNSNDIQISSNWLRAFEAVLDTYLGKAPNNFTYQGKNYTPHTFAKEVIGFKPEDYIELTSFSHHPFYQPFILEVPDNWANATYYNLPLDELEEVMNFALEKGYSIAWDGDVSEKEFSHKDGIASTPETEVTQEIRQEAFNNYSTTDDHLMHIVGVVTKDNGEKFYVTKNSWGSTSNQFGGYLYMSKNFVRLKSVGILIHKDAIPAEIAKKLAIR